MSQTIAWMTLSQLPGIGVTRFWQLINHFGGPEEVLRQTTKEANRISDVRNIRLPEVQKIDEVGKSCKLQIEKLTGMGVDIVTFLDPHYPSSLKEIADPPPILFVRGKKEVLSNCCIAIVGSRASTSYGRKTAVSFSRRLALAGVTVVSGLALGIDSQAHLGAIEAGGNTIGVLGCGIDIVYPKQNRELFDQVVDNGAIVTEYPLGTMPEAFRFPARNRIISGLSEGVLVVEAAKKSGSLITAQLALDEGREVFAVPGQIDSCKSEGTHWLLQQGAKLVVSENDIIEDLCLLPAKLQSKEYHSVDTSPVLDTEVSQLYNYIEPYPLSRDELLERSGINISEFSEFLLILELEGLVEILPGDKIARV